MTAPGPECLPAVSGVSLEDITSGDDNSAQAKERSRGGRDGKASPDPVSTGAGGEEADLKPPTPIVPEVSIVDVAANPTGNGVEVDAEGGVHDMSTLITSPDLSQLTPGELVITRVPVSKPEKSVFFRVKPEPDRWFIGLEVEGEWFLLVPQLAPEVPEAKRILIYVVCNRQGAIFLWPVQGADRETGDLHPAHAAKHDAARIAQVKWTSIRWLGNRKAYEIKEATGQLPEPDFPKVAYLELLEKAFNTRIIRDFNHPVLRKLRGEE